MAAIVMVVFLANILMISGSTDENNASQEKHAEVLALETGLLRQNSQLRGYLVTGDDSYLKSYKEGGDDYDAASAKLEKAADRPRAQGIFARNRVRKRSSGARTGVIASSRG
ncbi:MAG: CHASE3 domain-containing protein [Polyangiaceae bacterium]